MSRCKVYKDQQGLYLKHGDGTGVVKPISHAVYNRIYPPTQTVFNEGDTELKHHHSQSTVCTVRSLNKTIKERWYIES
jgi:hypothetical protein